MFSPRLLGRLPSIFLICSLAAFAPRISAAHTAGTVSLGGWVYVDRNNDGQLAFSNQANPEYVIGDVSVSLYSQSGNALTLLTTIQTDNFGRYFFDNLAPGTYALSEAQPVEFVDGKDTVGTLTSLIGQPLPGGASAGTSSNDAFQSIVLPADVGGDFYNFGELGLAPGYVSKRLLFASAPPPPTGGGIVPEPATILCAAIALCFCQFVRIGRAR